MGKLGKHDHKLTNLLKGGIFSLIMLAPLIAIGVSCLYVVNNKNAYESYYGETINESETITLVGESKQNILYTTSLANFITPMLDTGTYTIEEFTILSCSDTTFYNNVNGQDIIKIKFWYNAYNCNIDLTNSQNTTFTFSYIANLSGANVDYSKSLIFKYKVNIKETLPTPIQAKTTYTEYNNYSYLNNVFYYSIHNLEEQSTFNWVQNTAIYVPLNAMCSGLGITESAIPILLCYWSLITAIYIVFDIIIYLFTKMTHFLGTN